MKYECGCGYKPKDVFDFMRHLEQYHFLEVKQYHKVVHKCKQD